MRVRVLHTACNHTGKPVAAFNFEMFTGGRAGQFGHRASATKVTTWPS